MPAILVELGYLTNPEQAKMLPSDAFQNAVVQALFEAVVKFRDTWAPGGTH
jgi:N-acetylmuramoyl-L-alanine amidase